MYACYCTRQRMRGEKFGRPNQSMTCALVLQEFPVKVREQKDGRLIANFEGTSRLIFGQEEAMGLRLQLDGKTVVLPNIFDPRLV